MHILSQAIDQGVMSSPAPPALEEGVSGKQSDSESEVEESVPDTGQPVPVGEKAVTQALHQLGVNSCQSLSPQGQIIHSQWEANILPKGRVLGC